MSIVNTIERLKSSISGLKKSAGKAGHAPQPAPETNPQVAPEVGEGFEDEVTIQHAFEDEVFFSLRKQRDNWMKVSIGSSTLAALSILCLIIILPLNETKPYVIMVDKTTGEAEKIVQVRPATLEEKDAVLQAELVSYIADRETYDPVDNERRIPDVMSRSYEHAAASLAKVWSSSSPQYPPELYGEDTRIHVRVKSIEFTPAGNGVKHKIATVRIVKTREVSAKTKFQRSFVVTIGYKFQPDPQATLQSVWENPLGFRVISYRIAPENLENTNEKS